MFDPNNLGILALIVVPVFFIALIIYLKVLARARSISEVLDIVRAVEEVPEDKIRMRNFVNQDKADFCRLHWDTATDLVSVEYERRFENGELELLTVVLSVRRKRAQIIPLLFRDGILQCDVIKDNELLKHSEKAMLALKAVRERILNWRNAVISGN